MAINEDRVNTLKAAIEAKDTLAITRDNIYIPGLGTGYTEAQLIAWIQVRIDFLQLALDSTYEELVDYMNTVYAGLSETDQDTKDAILNDSLSLDSINENNIENLVKVLLFKFITS